MQIALISLTLIVLILLFLLGRTGRRLVRQRSEELEDLHRSTVLSWPSCAMIVPVAGNDWRIEAALTSLLEQDYQNVIPVMVTETETEDAARLIQNLKSRFPSIRHVVAGTAEYSGQKNHNQLAGIRAVAKDKVDCYVFCDSTHRAAPDFLQCLLQPIAMHKASFTTGYHEIVPKDLSTVTLAYAASVLIMRLLQALSVFTQPWGGAMAIRRKTFEEHDIAELWGRSVVDDCVLVTHLKSAGVRVHLVARALLATDCENYSRPIWEAWMERQILFPRFCVPVQWWLLGLMLLLFFAPLLICLEDLFISLVGGNLKGLFLPLLWFALFIFLICDLRRFLPVTVSAQAWLAAFSLALLTFLRVYIKTIGAEHIVWHGKVYTVGTGGVVLSRRPAP